MSKRETNVALRRQSVIDCAEGLIEASGGTDFAMEELARLAGVSLQTIYNRFGSKSAVLYELLNRTVETIDATRRDHSSLDPVDQVLDAVADVVAAYLARPQFYAALLRHLFGVVDEINRPIFMSKSKRFWHEAVSGIYRVHPECKVLRWELADDLLLMTTGALETWIQHDFSDAQFAAAMQRGTVLRLLALDLPGTKERLEMALGATRSAFA